MTMFKKEPRFIDKKWTEHIRTLPCFFTNMEGNDNEAVDPAHISTGGKGMKEHDFHVLPVIHKVHYDAHNQGEHEIFSMWLRSNKQACKEALQAYAVMSYIKHTLSLESNYEVVQWVLNKNTL